MPWAACALSLVLGEANVHYCRAYKESAKARVAPFKTRTNVFKALAGLAVIGMLATSGKLAMALKL